MEPTQVTPTASPSPAPALAPAAAQPPAPESDLWAGRTSLKHYLVRITFWVIGNVVAAVLIVRQSAPDAWLTSSRAFWAIVGVLFVSAILFLSRPVLLILGRHYRLTTQRLFIESGILSKTIDQTELIRVDDVRVYKSLFDRIFNLGTISLISTDVTNKEISIEGVSGAESVAESVRSHMRAQRGKALFVENL